MATGDQTRIVELLRAAPLIDGHNDLIWALRKARENGESHDVGRSAPTSPHRPAPPGTRRRSRSVLVGLRPVRPRRSARGRDDDARADRRVVRARAGASRPVGARAHGGRRRADRGHRARRLDDRGRGRPIDRLVPRGAPDPCRPRRRLPHAHPQRRHAVGGLGDGRAGARRPHDVRRGGGPRAEPARDARRSLPHVRGHDAAGDRGLDRPRLLLALERSCALRRPSQRSRRRDRAGRSYGRRHQCDLRALVPHRRGRGGQRGRVARDPRG